MTYSYPCPTCRTPIPTTIALDPATGCHEVATRPRCPSCGRQPAELAVLDAWRAEQGEEAAGLGLHESDRRAL